MHPLVTATWLHQNIQNQDLILLDASVPATVEGKTSRSNPGTIPGARFFDLKKEFSDPESPFPNTLPSPKQFERESRALGINADSKIIVFDNMGVYASPRVWWMFKAMGHEQVFVLDGGLHAWNNEGFDVEPSPSKVYPRGNFKAAFQPDLLKTYEDVVDNAHSQEFIIADARSAGRFAGLDSEPRKHLQSGHMPNSVNIPYGEVLNQGKFKQQEALTALFASKVRPEDQLVFSCGSGLTACIIMMASHLAGKESKLLYDGSWTEWAELQGLTIDN